MDYGFLHETMLGMTTEEIEESVKRNDLVLVPVGVVEEHGPHLPLGTDIYISMAQADIINDNLKKMNASSIIAPPFYFGGIRALTKLFAGTFTSKQETIEAAFYDYLASLDRFGYKRCVLLNNHGDHYHIESLVHAIKKANKELTLKTYWLEFEDDIEYDGFTKEDDFLAIMPPFPSDEFMTCEEPLVDNFDCHAGAYETAMMMELYKDEVRVEKMHDLKGTNIHGEEITRWVNGNKEDKGLIPHGYCGDPMKALKMKTHGKNVYVHEAKGLKDFFRL